MEQLPGKETVEQIDREIEQLLARMDSDEIAWVYNELGAEKQGEWYAVEMEAKCGKDRVGARERLKKFIDFLETEAKKHEGS